MKSFREFFVICNEGLENELKQELAEISCNFLALDGRAHPYFPEDIVIQKGGLTLMAPLEWGLQINFWSRLATRVLLRHGSARVRTFSELKNFWRDLQLEKKFPEMFLSIASKSSQLFHEEAIRRELGGARKAESETAQKVFLRLINNRLTVSLDTSGAALHLRGLNKKVGEAPIRETFAAWAVQLMAPLVQEKNLTIWDPFVGSGTCLLEVGNWNKPVQRNFAFQNWPDCPVILRKAPRSAPFPLLSSSSLAGKLLASDLSGQALSLAQENLQASGLEAQCFQGDFFKVDNSRLLKSSNSTCILTNPPYGHRLQGMEPRGQKSTFAEDFLKQCEKLQVEWVGVFFPTQDSQQFQKTSTGYTSLLQKKFSNGGLNTAFTLLRHSRGNGTAT